MSIHKIEVFVMVDQAGDYVVTSDIDTLTDAWVEQIGDVPAGTRVVKAVISIDMPEPTEITVSVPALAGKVTMTAK